MRASDFAPSRTVAATTFAHPISHPLVPYPPHPEPDSPPIPSSARTSPRLCSGGLHARQPLPRPSRAQDVVAHFASAHGVQLRTNPDDLERRNGSRGVRWHPANGGRPPPATQVRLMQLVASHAPTSPRTPPTNDALDRSSDPCGSWLQPRHSKSSRTDFLSAAFWPSLRLCSGGLHARQPLPFPKLSAPAVAWLSRAFAVAQTLTSVCTPFPMGCRLSHVKSLREPPVTSPSFLALPYPPPHPTHPASPSHL